MSTPDLDLTTRAAIDKALDTVGAYGFLTDDERAALVALRDACPEPRWLPTEDGVTTYVDVEGNRRLYYVRDDKVSRVLRPDGTLLCPFDPDDLLGTWTPYVHEVTPEQIARAADLAATNEAFQREPDAAYIATVHPGVGLALADWLDTAGADLWAHGPLCECGSGCLACDDDLWQPHVRRALDIADLILGSDR